MTRSARAPTAATDSPPGQPSRNSDQSGILLADLGGRLAVVTAVIPFHQVRIGLGDVSKAGQLGGPAAHVRECWSGPW